jgi:hypothetical protein
LFITHARSKGMDHQTIRILLLSAGWKEREISEAMASETLDMAVPLPPDMGSARDAFFHLLSFTALTSTVVSLIFLFFDYLNRLLPDPAFPDYAINDVSSIRWELAVLFVAFPLFVWMAFVLQKEFAAHHEKLASGVRRWLTYLTLFVTACTLVGDLIALIFSLLQGEITLRFLLKILTILVLTGMPFLYYFRVLKLAPESYARSTIHRMFLGLSCAVVAVAVVWGFLITGGPLRGRSERFDEQRLNDLRSIQGEISTIVFGSDRYVTPGQRPVLKKPIPKTLEDAAAQAVYQRLSIADPETSEPYEYTIVSDHAFRLCAVFAFERREQYDIFWDHPVGNHCYDFDLFDSMIR